MDNLSGFIDSQKSYFICSISFYTKLEIYLIDYFLDKLVSDQSFEFFDSLTKPACDKHLKSY